MILLTLLTGFIFLIGSIIAILYIAKAIGNKWVKPIKPWKHANGKPFDPSIDEECANNWNDPVFHDDNVLNPSFPCTGLNIFNNDND
jgi:hypothetical protein